MVFHLAGDVFLGRRQMRRTQRKRSVSVLPREAATAGQLLLRPLRGLALEFSNQRRDVERSSQTTKYVNVILRPPDADRRAFLLLANSCQISVDAAAIGVAPKPRGARLRRENHMKIDLGERLRHGSSRSSDIERRRLWNPFRVPNAMWRLQTQGALRDPGLCCETPAGFSTQTTPAPPAPSRLPSRRTAASPRRTPFAG